MALKDILDDTKKPHTVTFEKKDLTETYGKFVAHPFERGYATTVGNSLRRVLLSSIPGYGISAVKIEGVTNEFQNLDGMKEDTVVMIMHLKGIIVSINDDEVIEQGKEIHIKKTGPCVITAKDIADADSSIKVHNPDHYIATISEGTNFEMLIQIDPGYGYLTSEMNGESISEINVIPLDTVFSPVISVKTSVEDIRVGGRTDYGKLIMEVETNGSIAPDKALSLAAKILRDNLYAFLRPEEADDDRDIVPNGEEENELDKLKDLNVESVEFSVRTANFLTGVDLKTLDKVAMKTESDLLRLPGANELIVSEIKEKLEQYGAKLGMRY